MRRQEHELSEPTTRILDLSDYWNMIRARKFIVVVTAIVVAALCAAFVLLKPKQYFAQAKIVVTPLIDVAVTPVPGSTANTLQPDMATESEIVKSADVAKVAAGDLGAQSQDELVKHVSVGVVRDTTVMTIGFTASTPQAAAAGANAFATAYLSQRFDLAKSGFDQARIPLEAAKKTLVEQYAQIQRDIQNTSSLAEQATLKQQAEDVATSISSISAKLVDLDSQASVSQGGRSVQAATVPSSPVGPNLPLAIALGLVIGAVLGSGIAIIRGLRENKVGGRDELATHLSAPVMAVIPKVDGWDRAERAELVTREEPGAPASEAYRTLATNIRFFRSQTPLRVLVVSSAMPAEGKSATAANLAVILAETGLRTVLVDADLRRPRASRFIGVTDGPGLREALEGSRDLVDVIQATEIENLWIVGAGAVPQDPVSLLAGPNADAVFDGLRRVADIVVCDAPPVLPVADASVLAEESDAVLFVHDPGISNRTALEDAVRQLRTAGGTIIGGVYNNVSAAQRNYLGYASYDQYYGPDRARKVKVIEVPAQPGAGAQNGRASSQSQASSAQGKRT
jgi:capsular exopolysaccharide synthesis family protein